MRRRLLVMGSVLLLVLGVEGCTWDASLYDTYARNDSVTSCPPGKIATDSENNKYVDLNTLKCYAQDIEFKPDKSGLSILENNDVQMDLECVDENQNCIVYNDGDTQNKERCRNCALYIEDYRMCRALQDFKDIFAEDNVTMPSIDFIADYNTNLLAQYPEASKYRICPSDYGKCYYHKDDSESERGQFGCVSSCPSTMVECAGQCIDPKTNNNFCGAQGDCLGENVGESCDGGLKCVKGKCILECQEGYIKCPKNVSELSNFEMLPESDKQCVNPLKDTDFCGATAGCKDSMVCPEGQECRGDRCACTEGKTWCEGKDGQKGVCADLNTSNEYCGRCDTKCESDDTSERACVLGKCMIVSCKEGYEICKNDANENECIEVVNDPNNCGACGYRCADHPLSQATSNLCVDGKCQYTCTQNSAQTIENCGPDDFSPNCVDTMKNPDHCGVCAKQPSEPVCSDGQYCADGSCKTSECKNNGCILINCENTDERCGLSCDNCTSLEGVLTASCVEGVCKASLCRTGYHLKEENNQYKCEKNTNELCGAVDSVNTMDCTKVVNVTQFEKKCNDTGECMCAKCHEYDCFDWNRHEYKDYVLKQGAYDDKFYCVSPVTCGQTTCYEEQEGWLTGSCTDGYGERRCDASTCQEGYRIKKQYGRNWCVEE